MQLYEFVIKKWLVFRIPTNGGRNREKKFTGPISEFRHVTKLGIGQSRKLSVSRKLLDGIR